MLRKASLPRAFPRKPYSKYRGFAGPAAIGLTTISASEVIGYPQFLFGDRGSLPDCCGFHRKLAQEVSN